MTIPESLLRHGIRLKSYAYGEHRAACPRCAATKTRRADDALAVRIDDRGATWTCHRCNWTAGARDRGDAPPPPPRPVRAEPTAAERTAWALSLWRRTAPAAGTIVEVYLRRRGITTPPPRPVRFLASCRYDAAHAGPAMVAGVWHGQTGTFLAVHRTFLRPDGLGKADLPKARMALGPTAGGVIPLCPDPPGCRVAIAEGIETGLSFMEASGVPTWAAISAGGIESLHLPPLPLAADVIVAADHDPRGLQAAHAAAARFYREGRRVRVVHPPEPGTDWNDYYAAHRGAA